MTHGNSFTDTVLMIRPGSFGYNEETAASNQFQRRLPDLSAAEIQRRTIHEYEALRDLLRREGVEVIEFDDSEGPRKPDAIFPNNWFSTSPDGVIVLYPMEGENRRLERRPDIIEGLRRFYENSRIVDLTSFENEGRYLEGTGSMVLDRVGSVVYACLSSRTDREVLAHFASRAGFRDVVTFHADIATSHGGGVRRDPIYHTNVLMAIGQTAAVICDEAIRDEGEREKVLGMLENGGRNVVRISVAQLLEFAGNMLQLRSRSGDLLWVMSSRAFDSLSSHQESILRADGSKLIHSGLPTIETIGGGSARCMIAEIFQPASRPVRSGT